MPEFTVSIKEKIPMDLLITSTSICKGCLKTRRNFPIAFYQCFKRIREMPGLRSIFFQAVLYLAYVKLCILQGIRDFTRLDQKVCADIIIICCCIGIKIFKIIVRK